MVTRVLVDTNVLVSFLVDRSADQRRRAAALLHAAADPDRRLLLHSLVLAELAFVLRSVYEREAPEVAEILRRFLELPGAEIVDRTPWATLLELWPARFPDFLDASLAAVALELRPDAVATFDRAFARRLRALGLPTDWP
jgi:predicted nucleic acid-binding protein